MKDICYINIASTLQLNTKPNQKKITRKQKKLVINLYKKTKKNIFIKLKLEKELEKKISNKDDLLNNKEEINTGFLTLQTIYSLSISKLYISSQLD